ncbi:ubiquinone-binding protein [Acidihalobacter aeolianus]|uniref:Ubiquinone-binding protein n=1 Tax=Acidihalobacter aeolianus TaxID=2792603 RepID=A0A1D8K8N4_9GAMM|nr:type II toxin-antitoxin system RatA family toxin [Acidihalobacter aeolianus]AOV17339.1 ubiquinone-binding protein [Acidihalobacter aeolianus]
MTTVSRSALVNYTPQQMFALVDDIEHYADFLPWCMQTEILSRDAHEVKASIELARGGVRKTFATHNRMQAGKMIEIRLIEGPFSHLHGFWRFDPIGDAACKVSLDMEFDFSNRLLGLAVGPVFTQIVNTLVDAFVKRAREVYGEG